MAENETEKLTRTLEPEVMDTVDDAREYNRMDHSAVNKLFVDEYLALIQSAGKTLGPLDDDNPEDNGDPAEVERTRLGRIADVLDVGTGTALIPIELCKRTEEVRVMAIDLAVNMLELAIYNHEVASLRDRVSLGRIMSSISKNSAER